MKRFVTLFLVALLLATSAFATTTKDTYLSSGWAREDIRKAIDLGFARSPGSNGADYRAPITRGDFAKNTAYMVGLVFNTDMDEYFGVVNYRRDLEGKSYSRPELLVTNALGILQGRGGTDNWDENALINRQEAASMLARAYRVYAGAEPESVQPLSFADQGDIAAWAKSDVQLMNHLGIMKGTEDNRFNPLGTYTAEQCLVTLLRLYETPAASSHTKPSPFPMTLEEVIGSLHLEDMGELFFKQETKDYCIFVTGSGGTMSGPSYYTYIIDKNLTYRKYRTVVPSHYNPLYGPQYRAPENISLSADGTKLTYTSTVKSDVFYSNEATGVEKGDLLFAKGVYTVTLDLKTGEQTYTRTDLP